MIKTSHSILFVLILCMAACVNKHASNNTRVINIDTITYYNPEKYTEVVTDTVLDAIHNFRVIIKKASRMDKFVSQITQTDSTHAQQINYRDNAINLKVLVDNKPILDTLLSKENLRHVGDPEFLDKSIVSDLRIESFNKAAQTVTMSYRVLVPNSTWVYHYSLTANSTGKCDILLLEIH